MLIVAHRLSTIKNCDRIIVMDKGKILEQGTHEELLAMRGQYYHLWEMQQGNFILDDAFESPPTMQEVDKDDEDVISYT